MVLWLSVFIFKSFQKESKITMVKNYPKLGQNVDYIRIDGDTNKLLNGEGVIKAIFLNPDDRVMVQVKDGDNAWNCDLFAINASPDQAKAYEGMMEEIRATTGEGNELVKITVEEYNQKVEDIYSALLGDKIKV